MPVRGGGRLKAHIARQRRAVRELDGQKAIVGFEGFVSMVALQLEFGVPDRNIPERPAFRRARDGMAAAVRQSLMQTKGLPRQAALERAAEAARDALVRSYRTFRGPGLSPSRAEAKRGTPGEGRELVGPEGEKLIQSIIGRVVSQ